jgi:hypothetical protein
MNWKHKYFLVVLGQIFILFLLGYTFVHGAELSDKEKIKVCKEQLISDAKLIKGLSKLNDTQKAAFRELLDDRIRTTLTHEDDLFYLNLEDGVAIYDLDDNGEVKKIGTYKIDHKKIYQFSPRNEGLRPYSYFSSIFKLGVSFFYSDDKFYPDGAFIYEFFSFDKIFDTQNAFGLSINISVGLKHVGAAAGYQFVHSKYFKNTNLMLGYSFIFESKRFTPYIAVALGF